MKKKVIRPDGTVIEYEGTAEELAQLEESSGDDEKNESSKKGRRLLNEESVARMIEGALTGHELTRTHFFHFPPTYVHVPCLAPRCSRCNPFSTPLWGGSVWISDHGLPRIDDGRTLTVGGTTKLTSGNTLFVDDGYPYQQFLTADSVSA